MLVNLEPASNITEVKVDPWNALFPMLVIFAEIVTDVSFVPPNILFPIRVIPGGILTDVKLVARLKRPSPMLVTPDGMIMESKAVA